MKSSIIQKCMGLILCMSLFAINTTAQKKSSTEPTKVVIVTKTIDAKGNVNVNKMIKQGNLSDEEIDALIEKSLGEEKMQKEMTVDVEVDDSKEVKKIIIKEGEEGAHKIIKLNDANFETDENVIILQTEEDTPSEIIIKEINSAEDGGKKVIVMTPEGAKGAEEHKIKIAKLDGDDENVTIKIEIDDDKASGQTMKIIELDEEIHLEDDTDKKIIIMKSDDGDIKTIKKDVKIMKMDVDGDDDEKEIRIEIKTDGDDEDIKKWTDKKGNVMIFKSEDGEVFEVEVDEEAMKTIKMTEGGEDVEIEIEQIIEVEEEEEGTEENVFIFKSDNTKPGSGFLGVILDKEKGLYVSETVEGSAAEKCGLKEGDVITSINDQAVAKYEELIAELGKYTAGEEISVGYTRDDKAASTKATLGERSMDGMKKMIWVEDSGEEIELDAPGTYEIIEEVHEESEDGKKIIIKKEKKIIKKKEN